MYYSFCSFLILTEVTVIVSAVLLRRASRAEGVVDKITNTILHVVAPLYAAYNLSNLIFLILFSPHGLPSSINFTTYEGVVLANNILLLLSYFGVASALLVLSINKECWSVNADDILRTNMTTQQDRAQHMQSPQHWQPDDHTSPSVITMARPTGTSYTYRPQEQIHTAANSKDNNIQNSALRPMDEQVSLQYLTPTKLEIPNDLANRFSPVIPSFSQDKPLPVISAPNSLGPSAGPSGEPMRSATSAAANVPLAAQLTDEQIDFVGRLSSVNIPVTDIARLMESMRARGEVGGEELRSDEIRGGVAPGAAPPSYESAWS